MLSLDHAPLADPRSCGMAVPVIDLAPDAGTVTRAIGRACAEWGFFQVTGHGIDPAVTVRAAAETRGFFALPRQAKRAVSRGRDNPWGYYDRELTKNRRDKKEIFDIGPDAQGGAIGDDPFSGATPWPDAAPGFGPAMRAYLDACRAVAERLTEAMAASLGAPGLLAGAFRAGDTSFLRLNHYPVHDPLGADAEGEADLGIHHHTDAGALTVLLQDGVRGLEVYRDGLWHSIEPVAGALVINIGDMMQVWSNDRYRAPIHRVRAMDRVDRYSIPFFYNPAYEVVVAPIDAAVADTGGAAHYAGIPWGEYRRRRADGDFADYGAEVQIADYRIHQDISCV